MGTANKTRSDTAPDAAWSAARIMAIVDERLREDDEDGARADPARCKASRANIAMLLAARPTWPKPRSINANTGGEILVVWETFDAVLDVDTANDGAVEYYVRGRIGPPGVEGALDVTDAAAVRRLAACLDRQAVAGRLDAQRPV